MRYHHELPTADRGSKVPNIYTFSREYFFQETGKIIGVSASTVSREIKRHCIAKQAYNPALAHAKALAVRHKKQPARIAKSTVYVVEKLLELDWSPEQISGVCQRQQMPVSHEWIYQHIHADFKAGGRLYLHLRHRLKRYKKTFPQAAWAHRAMVKSGVQS